MAIVNSRAAIEPKTGKAAIFVNETIHSLMRKLFANNEQGFAYDPNDLSTLYQDAAGTVPVTSVGQPVGLIRDKSGRNNHAYQTVSASRPVMKQTPILGAELIVNGNFSNGTSAWLPASGGTLVGTNGKALLTSTVTGITQTSQSIANLAGKTVKVSCKFSNRVGNAQALIALWSGTATSGTATSGTATAGYLEFITTLPTPHTGTVVLQLSTGIAGNAVEFDDVSVKEVLGYRTDQNYLDFDAVDDKLITNLPTQLTGCTVVRSVPNVGTQVLTGQTIPATYEDNKDYCGLIVINRALTPSETSAITAEFNKRAGV